MILGPILVNEMAYWSWATIKRRVYNKITDFWIAQLSGNEHRLSKYACVGFSKKLIKHLCLKILSPRILWNQRPLSLGT